MKVGDGSGSAAPAQGKAPSGAASIEKATLVGTTPADLKSLMKAGWIPGSIVSSQSPNTYIVATQLGEITLSIKAPDISVGGRIMLYFDATSGKMFFTTFRGENGSAATSQVNPKTQLSPGSSLSKIALAGSSLPPITQTLSGTVQSQQTLSAIFPYAQSTSFALAVALFPMTARGGIIGRLMEHQEKRYGPLSRLTRLAGEVRYDIIKPIDGGFGHVSWGMPFFSEGKIYSTHWQQGEQASIEDERKTLKRTFLEVYFEFSGKLQIESLMDHSNASVIIVSEREIPGELMEEIREIIHLISISMGISSNVSYDWGPDLIQPL